MSPEISDIRKTAKQAQKNPKAGVRHVAERVIARCDPLTERITGNRVKTTRNIQGAYEIKRAQRKSTVKQKNTPEVNQLRKNQCLALGNPYDTSLIKSIEDKFDQIVENPDKSLVRSEYDETVYSRMVVNLWKQIPEVRDLLTPEIQHLIRQYYGANFQVRHLVGWRNYHVPESVIEEAGDVFSDFWHNDGKPTSWFKLFIVLRETTDEHGPLHILPKPATEALVRSDSDFENYDKIREQLRGNPAVVKLTGKPGSAILGNTEQCLHRAGFPDEGNIRDIIQFQFTPASEPLRDDWESEIHPKPAEEEWLSSNTL
jgi:ectoine hydroxylase-related dioxygenase (phytanoyl-CoA dioxygenase family)